MNDPTPEGRCRISDDLVALSAPDALIGGDDPAGGHPLGGRQAEGTKAQRHEGTKCECPTLRAFVPPCLRACHSDSSFRSAFTLIEILIVIGIIVLLIGIAIPAFNAISGSRSIDNAANTVSAFVGRARLEAIGLQEARGVMFFLDPVSQEAKVAIVKATSRPGLNNTEKGMSPAAVDLYLDLASDTDFLTIPSGVGIQVVDDCTFNNAKVRLDDGFLGFNGVDASGSAFYYQSGGGNAITTQTVTSSNQALSARPGGVILFDAQGRLICSSFAFKTRQIDSFGNFQFTAMGKRLFTVNNTDAEARTRLPTVSGVADVIPWQQLGPATPRSVRSQVGFVLFDKSAFESRGSNLTDPQLTGVLYSSDANEISEETWLDENATVYLVNRYNGTLVKGE